MRFEATLGNGADVLRPVLLNEFVLHKKLFNFTHELDYWSVRHAFRGCFMDVGLSKRVSMPCTMFEIPPIEPPRRANEGHAPTTTPFAEEYLHKEVCTYR